ncbi:MAG TPA: hypothetical protein VGA64_04375, partial [Candidatus Polarisedimenticolia bacterium]
YYYPLARTVIGGLASSTVLTLLVLPYINLGIEAAAAWFRRLWVASSPRGAAAPLSGPAAPSSSSGLSFAPDPPGAGASV